MSKYFPDRRDGGTLFWSCVCGQVYAGDKPSEVRELEDELEERSAAIEEAWGIIANAFDGNWDKAPPEWRQAAEKWCDTRWRPRPR